MGNPQNETQGSNPGAVPRPQNELDHEFRMRILEARTKWRPYAVTAAIPLLILLVGAIMLKITSLDDAHIKLAVAQTKLNDCRTDLQADRLPSPKVSPSNSVNITAAAYLKGRLEDRKDKNALLHPGDLLQLLTPLETRGQITQETASKVVDAFVSGGRDITVHGVETAIDRMLADPKKDAVGGESLSQPQTQICVFQAPANTAPSGGSRTQTPGHNGNRKLDPKTQGGRHCISA